MCTLAPLANHCYEFGVFGGPRVGQHCWTRAQDHRRDRSTKDEAECRKFTYECLISCVCLAPSPPPSPPTPPARRRRDRGDAEYAHDWMWRAIAPLAMLIIPANYANGGRGRGRSRLMAPTPNPHDERRSCFWLRHRKDIAPPKIAIYRGIPSISDLA